MNFYRHELFPSIKHHLSVRQERNRFLASEFDGYDFRYPDLSPLAACIVSKCDGQTSINSITQSLGATPRQLAGVWKKLSRILEYKTSPAPSKKAKFHDPVPEHPPLEDKRHFKMYSLSDMISRRTPQPERPIRVRFRVYKQTPFEQCLKIMENIMDSKPLELQFAGQSYQHPDFIRLVQIASKRGSLVKVYVKRLDTLSAEEIDILINLDIVLIYVALHGYNARTHNLIQPDSDYDLLCRTMHKVRQKGIWLTAYCLLYDETMQNGMRLLKNAQKLGLTRYYVTNEKPVKEEFPDAAIRKKLQMGFWKRRWLTVKFRTLSMFVPITIYILEYCAAGLTECSVDSTGAVGPCAILAPKHTASYFGNALEMDLVSIWQSEAFKNFHNPKARTEPCRSCIFYKFPFMLWQFNRCIADCRRNTMIKTGDPFAGTPKCPFAKVFSRPRKNKKNPCKGCKNH